jgi:hypothetical protein
MALLNENNPVRMAHAVSQTMVSLAVLTKENFRSICEFYPEFRMKISKMVKFRINMNKKIQEHRRTSLNALTVPGANRALEVIQEADSLNDESVMTYREQKLKEMH